MIELNYGKYSIPKTLETIIKLQEQLDHEGLLEYGALLGNYFSYDGLESRYLNTPLDVIPFARPGSDGIHYGFLTDFGQVKDLESAYIVRVSPMDFDHPVQIVARNLHDFMRILCYWPSAIEMIDITTGKSDFERLLKDELEASFDDINNVSASKINKTVRESFQLAPIDSLYEYLQEVKKEREHEIVLPTEDGIGVVYNSINEAPSIIKGLFNFNGVETLLIKDVKPFFEHSSSVAKLVFLRDAQSKGLIFDNQELKFFLKEQLLLLNLQDESARISFPD
ncbi:hypothetical protein QE429_004582 [Bacillus sp. SORGH_AS 510]|uniref:hypothetical protein n=1 Tax=Bacillus sp. SORGH_AS_0510 TaxID=3041771 RepID=UPI002781916A|nr:hypothetical protein [Bacillus sp. SORGH_AS_0510]MDQ1147755.1 hypothetical protein [Bacillus sp. SORGH_AS_0510]